MKLRHVTQITFRQGSGGWLCELQGREKRGTGNGMCQREIRGYGPDGRGKVPYRLAKSLLGIAWAFIDAWSKG